MPTLSKHKRIIEDESDEEDSIYKRYRRRMGDDDDESIDNGEGPSTLKEHVYNNDSGYSETEVVTSEEEEDEQMSDDDRYSQHSAYSNKLKGRRPSPEIIVIISQMGTKKTEIMKEETRMLPSQQQPAYLSISPRRLMTKFAAKEFGLTDYQDRNLLLRNAEGKPKGARWEKSELLCAQRRLAICINSIKHLRGREYDIVILDEFYTTAMMIASKIMLNRVDETVEVLTSIIKRAKKVYMLAADGDLETIQTLLSFIDWSNPKHLKIVVNEGGVGGIHNQQMYLMDDVTTTCRVLKKYIQEGKTVYVPTNQARFAEQIVAFCKQLGLQDDEIMHIDQYSPDVLKEEMIKDPLAQLGLPSARIPVPTKPIVRVLVVTSAFGVGFSIKGANFDATIAYFFTYPLTIQGNVQQLARVRGNSENIIFCYYQKQKPEKRNRQHELNNLRMAVDILNQRLANLDNNDDDDNDDDGNDDDVRVGGDRIKSKTSFDGLWQKYAITLEIFQRQSRYDGCGMFVESVEKATSLPALLIHSWLVNSGDGPVRVLPNLTEDEIAIVTTRNIAKIDGDDLPTTQDDMMELWEKLVNGEYMTQTDTRCVQLYKLLSVPTGNLKPNERTPSFVKKTNAIGNMMDVAAHGTLRPLDIKDAKKHTQSLGISATFRDERVCQGYQLYDIWARLALAGLNEEEEEEEETVEEDKLPGIALMEKFINACDTNANDGEDTKTILKFKVEIVRLKKAICIMTPLLDSIKRTDADVDAWFVPKDWDKFIKSCNDVEHKDIVKNYNAVLRKGFRQIFSTSNIQAESVKKDNYVHVSITNVRRAISLACVQWVASVSKHGVRLSHDDFSILDKFRTSEILADIIPTNEELVKLCGI